MPIWQLSQNNLTKLFRMKLKMTRQYESHLTEKLNKCFGQSNIWCGVINCPLSRLVPRDILGLYFYSNLSTFPFISFRVSGFSCGGWSLVDLHDVSVYCLAGHILSSSGWSLTNSTHMETWCGQHPHHAVMDGSLFLYLSDHSHPFQFNHSKELEETTRTARSLKCGET